VAFTPFCRPTQDAVLNIARLFYSIEDDEQRVDVMYDILKAVWSKGRDLSFAPHVHALQQSLQIEKLTEVDVSELLQQNDQQCYAKHQPDFPVLELRIAGQSYVFNSLYRVWMIESIFSHVLEQQYKQQTINDSSKM
jgi:hypothetical protein